MNTFKHILTIAVTGFIAASAYGQIATFDFTAGSFEDSANIANLEISTITTDSSFNTFTSSSGWDSAAQISGASSFFSSPMTISAAGDAVSFTITAVAGYEFSITDFSFQARSTSTAPADIGFTINGDGYDFSTSYSNNSAITTIGQSALGYTGLTFATISIQAWNASSSGALQLDNITVTGIVSAVPESSAYALLTGLCAVTLIFSRRRRA